MKETFIAFGQIVRFRLPEDVFRRRPVTPNHQGIRKVSNSTSSLLLIFISQIRYTNFAIHTL